MVRTQIQLSEEQAEGLRRLAAERRISMAAVVREAVDRLLGAAGDTQIGAERVLALAGKYSSGTGDVSEKHDDYFAEAVLDDVRR